MLCKVEFYFLYHRGSIFHRKMWKLYLIQGWFMFLSFYIICDPNMKQFHRNVKKLCKFLCFPTVSMKHTTYSWYNNLICKNENKMPFTKVKFADQKPLRWVFCRFSRVRIHFIVCKEKKRQKMNPNGKLPNGTL